MRKLRVGALALAAAIVAACDPCTSLTGCADRAQFTVTGRLLREATAEPVAGARLDFIRDSGVVLDADSSRAVTDESGGFTLRVGAQTSGLVYGSIVVRSAAGDAQPFGYRVDSQVLRAFSDVGDANVLPVWSTEPSLPDIAMLVSASAPAASLAGVSVEFRRTGGIALREGDVFRTTTRSDAVFELFDRHAHPVDAGDVVGDLYIGTSTILRDVRVTATPEFRRNPTLRLITITP